MTEFQIFDRYFAPGTAFWELGAFHGDLTLHARPQARQCVAVEPDPVAFEALKLNIDTFPLKQISGVRAAIFNATGHCYLGNDAELGDGTSRFNCGQNLFSVEVHTMASMEHWHRVVDVGYIRMDIEGGEEFALSDPWWETHHPLVHLSLHPHYWFSADVVLRNVRAVCRHYRHVLDENLKPVDVNGLLSAHELILLPL